MHPDKILKELFESIARKETAKSEAEGSKVTYFDLEITRSMDKFEARCMLLLGAVLDIDDRLSLIRYFHLLEASAPPEFITKIYANLFQSLVREVLSRLDTNAKNEIIEKLKLFDESHEE